MTHDSLCINYGGCDCWKCVTPCNCGEGEATSDVSMSQSLGHDPLCPPKWWPIVGRPCAFCELIAKVREDMLAKCIDTLTAYMDETHKHVGDLFGHCRHEYGDRCDITAAMKVCILQLHTMQEKP